VFPAAVGALCLAVAAMVAVVASIRTPRMVMSGVAVARGPSIPVAFQGAKTRWTLNQPRAQTQILLKAPKAACSAERKTRVSALKTVASQVAEAVPEKITVGGLEPLTMRVKEQEKIPIQAVILDLDGVLLDYETVSNEALNEALERYNKSGNLGVDWNLHSKLIGLRIQEVADVVLGCNRLLDRIDPKKYIEKYYEKLQPKYDNLDLMDGARELLASLKEEGYPIALVTSSSRESLDKKMLNFKGIIDVMDSFDVIVTGDDAMVNYGKKSTDMFLLAAERMAADPKKVLVLDDSPMAVWSAKAAGMYAGAVPDARIHQDYTNGGPDFKVHDLKEFAKLEKFKREPLKRVSIEDLPVAELNDMPVTVGFGTDLIHTAPEGVYTCDDKVLQAIDAGYRLIDTATKYESEGDVGRALDEAMKKGMKREDFYVVTKVWVNDMGYESAIKSVESSLRRLRLDYVDCVLIHWPGPAPGKPEAQQFGWENKAKRVLTWRALEELVRRGKVKSIGVANWTIRHLKETLAIAEILPTVNQVEMHPYYTRNRLLDYCTRHGIKLMGYSPFGRGRLNIINDPVMGEIGEKYGKSGAQVILRWMIQRGVVPLPRASSEPRIKQNFDLFDFELTKDEVETIDALNGDKRSCSIDSHSIP